MASAFGWPERTERCGLTLVFDRDTLEENRELVEDLLRHAGPTLQRYDEYKLDFDFVVEYRGVVKQMVALTELLSKPEILVEANMEEQSGKPMIFVEMIDELRRAQAAIEARIA